MSVLIALVQALAWWAVVVLLGAALAFVIYAEGEEAGYRAALRDVAERDAELEASRRRIDQALSLGEAERILREDGGKWR